VAVNTLKLLFIADIVGQPGRRVVKELVPKLRQQGIGLIFPNPSTEIGPLGSSAVTQTN